MSQFRHTYLTTTLPYVNADPHIGFALEIIQADIMARYFEMIGDKVFFNTGTDEHGLKIYRKALENNEDVQEYVNRYADKFKSLMPALGIYRDINFIRTTDENHIKAAQEFWNRCLKNGDIYKKFYEIKYCVGCENEKTESELENGKCPLHPTTPIEAIAEENYFFKFSAYKDKLLALYEENPFFVRPESRMNEIFSFVSRGLQDFSISRKKEKMPWGIPVPGDDSHVMYVWFDALVNYVSAIGFPDNMEMFDRWWPVIQFAGKDNLRHQSAVWQAMLMSAGLPTSSQIIIHGMVMVNGEKMSKSVGNVINPLSIVSQYGNEPLRYFLAREMSTFEDSDFTDEKFKETYNAQLANGIGNLTSRIMKMSTTHLDKGEEGIVDILPEQFVEAMRVYDIKKAYDYVWERIAGLDRLIQEEEPFKVIKESKDLGEAMIRKLLNELFVIATMLEPLLPETSRKIKNAIKENEMPAALFPRKD